MNRQPVICISNRSGECERNGLLLTLDPRDNPDEVLKNLFDTNIRANSGEFVRGDRDKTIIDFTKFLHYVN